MDGKNTPENTIKAPPEAGSRPDITGRPRVEERSNNPWEGVDSIDENEMHQLNEFTEKLQRAGMVAEFSDGQRFDFSSTEWGAQAQKFLKSGNSRDLNKTLDALGLGSDYKQALEAYADVGSPTLVDKFQRHKRQFALGALRLVKQAGVVGVAGSALVSPVLILPALLIYTKYKTSLEEVERELKHIYRQANYLEENKEAAATAKRNLKEEMGSKLEDFAHQLNSGEITSTEYDSLLRKFKSDLDEVLRYNLEAADKLAMVEVQAEENKYASDLLRRKQAENMQQRAGKQKSIEQLREEVERQIKGPNYVYGKDKSTSEPLSMSRGLFQGMPESDPLTLNLDKDNDTPENQLIRIASR